MTTDSFFDDARKKEAAGIPEFRDFMERLKASRIMYRGTFKGDGGIRILARMCFDANVFGIIDPSDPEAIGRRNMVIDLFDNMGLLDEANMESIIRYMLSLPVVPAEKRKE